MTWCDKGALATLEELPAQEALGTEFCPTVFIKAAVYIRNILFAHPFTDGNKRTAMGCADIFLQLNGYRIIVEKGGVEKYTGKA
ncbi:MAG: type II toxin-antitoxin system death-on-curing family toxin [Candidatus Pacebacteria bacterium]|nr:type II toxin-antitoxin system death-on-curing family toxin [Candidatus Paceibacterota bacterium]